MSTNTQAHSCQFFFSSVIFKWNHVERTLSADQLRVGKMVFASMKKNTHKVHLPKIGLGLYDLEPHSLGTKNTEYKFSSAPKESI